MSVYDRLKKQERNDRLTALLPRIQRSRIIPNKIVRPYKTRTVFAKKSSHDPEKFPISTLPDACLLRQYAKYRSSRVCKFVLRQTTFERWSCTASPQQARPWVTQPSDRARRAPRNPSVGAASSPSLPR